MIFRRDTDRERERKVERCNLVTAQLTTRLTFSLAKVVLIVKVDKTATD